MLHAIWFYVSNWLHVLPLLAVAFGLLLIGFPSIVRAPREPRVRRPIGGDVSPRIAAFRAISRHPESAPYDHAAEPQTGRKSAGLGGER